MFTSTIDLVPITDSELCVHICAYLISVPKHLLQSTVHLFHCHIITGDNKQLV